MKAIVISEYGGPEKLVIQDLPVAKPGSEQVLVEVKAFGVNRAETYMRKGAWGEVAKVSGIECVGVVKEDPSGNFAPGQKVTALMGGLGRTINGSYAQFTCPPATNVVPLKSSLGWGPPYGRRTGPWFLPRAAFSRAVRPWKALRDRSFLGRQPLTYEFLQLPVPVYHS